MTIDDSQMRQSQPRPARAQRHSWSEPHRYERHTDRACWHCGLIRRTRHEDGRHWVEFVEHGGALLAEVVVARPGNPTPACAGERSIGEGA